MKYHITKGSVLDDLGFSKAEANNLKIRAALMRILEKKIKARHLTQAQAAKLLKISQPRVSDIKQGRVNKFTIDTLVNLLAKMQTSISLVVDDRSAA